jgi:hypothetical protein
VTEFSVINSFLQEKAVEATKQIGEIRMQMRMAGAARM